MHIRDFMKNNHWKYLNGNENFIRLSPWFNSTFRMNLRNYAAFKIGAITFNENETLDIFTSKQLY